ncbi:hypothetical protein HMPREF3189_01003, partial [Clostridiales bacterium KA00134]
AAWVGDTLDSNFWKDGVKLKDTVTDKTLKDEFNKAKVTDLGEGGTIEAPKAERKTEKAGDFKGNLKVEFSDGSSILVKDQTLHVKDHVLPGGDTNAPSDAIKVKFMLGEGVKVEKKDANSGRVIDVKKGDKAHPLEYATYLIKPNTNLGKYIHPTLHDTIFNLIDAKAIGGYENVKWKPDDKVVTNSNKVFTASAVKEGSPIVSYAPIVINKGESKTARPIAKNVPSNTSYHILDSFQAPHGINVTIDPSTGVITVFASEDALKQDIRVPVELRDSTTLQALVMDKPFLDISILDKSPGSDNQADKGFGVISFGAVPSRGDGAKLEEGYSKAYIFGYPDKTVRADGNVSRAEAVLMVSRLQEYDLSDTSKPVFADTKANTWYAGALNAAYKAGILEEKAGERFRPNDKMTRAELAKLISYIDKKNDAIAPFEDVKGHKFEAAINQCYGNNRIKGYPDGTFRPDSMIRRGEITSILNSLYNRKVRAEGLKGVTITNFIDISPRHWAYYEIIEASHNHYYRRMRPNDIEEIWLRVDK